MKIANCDNRAVPVFGETIADCEVAYYAGLRPSEAASGPRLMRCLGP